MSVYLRDVIHVDWRTLKFSRGPIKVQSGETGGISFVANIPSANQLSNEDKVLDCHGKLVTRTGAKKLWRRLV